MTNPRWQRRLATGALVTLVTSAITSGVTTAPAGASTTSPPIPALDRIATRAQQQDRDITLITGDTVHTTVTSTGSYQTSVEAARRPDGRPVFFQNLVDGDHLYVLPSDAAGLVAAGQLDRRLFDVRQLLADGYGDATTTTLPVIVSYRGEPTALKGAPATRAKAKEQMRAKADALPASTKVRALAGVNGAGAAVTKRQAASFWSTVVPAAGARSLGQGLGHVWLDAKVTATLDQSVPMIGAPQAWAAGYDGSGVTVAVLDTGIDGSHPDLAGKVLASKSFVAGATSVADGNGHGTHVASTIVGSGAASGGRYKGVAPGAELVVGKVLSDGATGTASEIIEGMEWAAVTQDADVVNMSLGSDQASDGTDPISRAVDTLTADTGALFVVAAGNSGPAAATIGTPGAAAAALTVGAVDKSDQLADFSSRGPLTATYGLKPDIAGPGVDIVAARAAGTSLGTIVDASYTSLSGTSMATPHVAGAAAILAQEHSDWTPAQLKAALTSTAKDDGYRAYEQGAGRVDIAAAVSATTVAGTVNVDFGRLRYPQTGPAISKAVTFRNGGGQPVTLGLTGQLADGTGAAAPHGMLSVSPASLVVPAGGTAEATVVLDPTLGPIGKYSGAITAVAAGGSLRVPVAAYKEPEGFDLTAKVVPPSNATTSVPGVVIVRRTDVDDQRWVLVAPGATVHLDAGVYSATTAMVWADSPGDYNNQAVLTNPQVELKGDTTVTLDANRARKVEFDTGRPTEVFGATLNVWQTPAGATAPFGVVSGQVPYGVQPWATPTKKTTVGTFLFDHTHLVGTPLVTASSGRLTLHPRYQHYTAMVAKLAGQMTLPVVDVGTGTAGEFARVKVAGKVALINVGDGDFRSWGPGSAVQNAVDAGATAVLGYSETGRPRMFTGYPGIRTLYPLPMLGIPADEGAALLKQLHRGPVSIRINSQPTIPQLYTLSYLDKGAIPAALRYRVSDRNLAVVSKQSHADRPITESWQARPRWPGILDSDDHSLSFSSVALQDLPGPSNRTEYFGPTSAARLWGRATGTNDLAGVIAQENHTPDNDLSYAEHYDVFDHPVHRTEVWGQAPTAPGSVVFSPAVAKMAGQAGVQCSVCRYSGLLPDGDLLPIFTLPTDGWGNFGELTTYSNVPSNPQYPGTDVWHMYAGDTELPQFSFTGSPGILPYYVLPRGAATYRLTEQFVDHLPKGGYGTKADTTWRFSTATPTAKETPSGYDPLGLCTSTCRVEPLVFLGYRFNLATDNRLAAPGAHTFTITAYKQASLAATAPIAGMKVSVSFDGGRHWSRVPVTATGKGTYRVVVSHPRLTGTTGSVSLRTEAWDAAGNRVEQTLRDAYGLVSRH